MKTLLRWPCVLALLLRVSTPSAYAQEVVNPNCDIAQETPLSTMVSQSSIVVEGKASARRGFWNAAHNRIFTATTVTVYKVFKGQIQGNQVEFITPGGQVGEQMDLIQDGPDPKLQGAGLFFGVPTQQAPTGSALPTAQVLDVFNVYEGYLTYRGDETKDHNAAFSACRRYRDIPTTLYAPIQQAAGHPYQELAPFNIDTYDRYAELRHSPMEEPLQRLTPTQKKSPSSNRNASTSQSIEAGLVGPTAVPTITGFNTTSIKAGTFDQLIITGSGFVDGTGNKPLVFFRNVDVLQNPQAPARVPCPAENIQVTNTQITLVMPSNVDRTVNNTPYLGIAGSGTVLIQNANGSVISTTSLNVFRAETTVDFPGLTGANQFYRQLRLTGPSSRQGYEFYYEPSMYAMPQAVKDAEQALRRWRQRTTVNLGDDNSFPVSFIRRDAVCNIGFQPQPPGPRRFAMQTTLYVDLCTDNTRNGQFLYVSAVDIEINPNIAWHYDTLTVVPATEVDFHSALMHEFGHAIALDHIDDPSKVMHAATASAGTFRRKLRIEPELNGAANVLSRSSTQLVCTQGPYTPMVAITSPSVQTGADLLLTPNTVTYCTYPDDNGNGVFAASGATSYLWGPTTRSYSPSRTVAQVTTSLERTRPIYCYGMKDGLGDVGIVYFDEELYPCAPPPTGFRTSAYPNPSTGDVTVEYRPGPGAHDLELTLHNAQGTTLQTFRFPGNSQRRQFPIRGLAQGIYFLRTVVDSRTQSTIRLQVQ
jgi:hypothetical protein